MKRRAVMERLPGALADAGVTVTHLRPTEPTLEDVFTAIAGRNS